MFNLKKKVCKKSCISSFKGSVLFCLFFGLNSIAYADLDDLEDLGKKPKDQEKPATVKPVTNEDAAQRSKSPSSETDIGSKSKPLPTASSSIVEVPAKPAGAQSKTAAGSKSKKTKDQVNVDKKLPISWSASGLKGSRGGKIIDLVRDVVVTQGDMKMTADTARVYFDDSNQVTKVVAKDNVKMTKKATATTEQMQARGDEATFLNSERSVELRGRAALWRGTDVVRGKKITYGLDDGWITVDRVEGVLRANDSETGNATP